MNDREKPKDRSGGELSMSPEKIRIRQDMTEAKESEKTFLESKVRYDDIFPNT